MNDLDPQILAMLVAHHRRRLPDDAVGGAEERARMAAPTQELSLLRPPDRAARLRRLLGPLASRVRERFVSSAATFFATALTSASCRSSSAIPESSTIVSRCGEPLRSADAASRRTAEFGRSSRAGGAAGAPR